ncbi:MAG TPA: CRISPR-associated endonuclease Cas1, partial [Gammaproteobacteria bacterium]|nr:CRISPR-associated endonuclease Cas1 [Gammaproteobacteria bacterium]
RDNLRLIELQDGFTDATVHSVEELSLYDFDTLMQETAIWREQRYQRLRWISPVRLLKDKTRRKGLKGEARFCHDASDIDMPLLLSRLHDRLADSARRDGRDIPRRPPPPNIDARYTHVFWLDNHYTDARGGQHVVGGLCGLIEFDCGADSGLQDLLPLLVLGQFTGMGQRSAFGMGRYLLETPDGRVTHRRCLPARSLLMRAMDPDNLEQAWSHIHVNREEQPDDEEDREYPAQEESAGDDIEGYIDDLTRIQEGSYRAPELAGYLIDKPSGGQRALCVPPFRDRVLQRALAQVLTPALEPLFYVQSHGYRPGRSRHSARDAIQAAWRAGYRWVYESDIEDFFDSVDHQRLRERLTALYDNDPAIDAIIEWMSAPVRFGERLIERPRGLPQGSPLSPLMANLMLDDFDNDLRDAGFLLIRYADDFVILCRDREQAEQAHQAATRSLAEHGFRLNPDKTQIKSMEQGFRYLGYLFVNDMALDVGSEPASGKSSPGTAPVADDPPDWLRNLSERPRQRLTREQAGQAPGSWLSGRAALQTGERIDEGALICITGMPAVISTRGRQMQVHRDRKQLHSLPWNSIQAVILFGNHAVTTPAIQAALQAGVAIHYASGSGRYHGCLWSGKPAGQGYPLWLRQQQVFSDPDRALLAARQIVSARIIHIKETLRQRHLQAAMPELDQCLRQVSHAESLEQLNGFEGQATRLYFGQLQSLLPEFCGFEGRKRRPPTDPFNALLSLGYTLLYGYTDSILRACGLLPWLGFYHQPRGRHAALASDLMEPFRHLVERTALSQLTQHVLKEEDFHYSDAGACRLSDAARRKYLAALTARFDISLRARGDAESRKIFDHMQRQCLSLIGWIDQGEAFHCWRIR